MNSFKDASPSSLLLNHSVICAIAPSLLVEFNSTSANNFTPFNAILFEKEFQVGNIYERSEEKLAKGPETYNYAHNNIL